MSIIIVKRIISRIGLITPARLLSAGDVIGEISREIRTSSRCGKLGDHSSENVAHSERTLSRDFDMLESALFRIRCGIVSRDLTKGVEVDFVPNENDSTTFDSSLYLANPAFCLVQTFGRSDIVDNYGGRRTSVVHWGQTAVAFLAGGVPDIERNLSPFM
tara:strand:- start:808 stop:1287 length:480 start_codon:yes stop_codon:yes gene_type:complete